MNIRVKQIDNTELASFVNLTTSGYFSTALTEYIRNTGYFGTGVFYTTGGTQIVTTNVSFGNMISVPYSGGTGSAVNKTYFLDTLSGSLVQLSGVITGGYVPIYGNFTIYDAKTFTGAVSVGTPVGNTHAVTLGYLKIVSGMLQTGLNTVTVANSVTTDTAQFISGVKTFTVSPWVPTPTASSGVANKAYVDNLNITGIMHITGDETVNGVKTFVQSPIVPVATTAMQSVPKMQLDALGTSIGGITGFAGVLSLNGASGASGHLYLVGAGTVGITQCESIFYVSGYNPALTNFVGAVVSLPSGITGVSYTFSSGFGSLPTIAAGLEYSGQASISTFPSYFVYGKTTGGFNVAFSTGIPSTGFGLNVICTPVTGSGFYGIQGQQGSIGPYAKPRGVWQAGVGYGYLDFVYNNDVQASYIATQSYHVSDTFNKPAGTGNLYWNIFSSGIVGATGYWMFRGDYSTGSIYITKNSVTYNGSSFGYTGLNSTSGCNPDLLTSSGWTLVARKGDAGYFVNSGTITGNFVNMSFFLEPVGTGLEVAESFVSRTFMFTGYALGCVNSGVGPSLGANGILSGNIYVRDLNNTRTNIASFNFNSGIYSKVSGGFAQEVTGLYRVGIDVTNILSGIKKFSVGIFGFGGQNV